MNVVMLLYPDMTQLDLTGPFEVFSRFKELKLHLAWKSLDPVVISPCAVAAWWSARVCASV